MTALIVSAVVLAAGQSTRMQGAHKLTLDVGGRPMIRRTVEAVLGLAPAETVVVTGFAAPAVGAALDGLPVRLVHNRRFEEGQPISVAAGVRGLEQFCHVVMVVPGDQPLLTPPDLRALLDAFRTMPDGRSILVPFHRGKRGTPVLFAAHHVPEVAGGSLNVGCRHLIESQGDRVARVEFATDVYTIDCDTPADYAGLAARWTGAAA